MLLCYLLFAATNVQSSNSDFDRALGLWREFGKPVGKSREDLGDYYDYGNRHFNESVSMMKRLQAADSGKPLTAGKPEVFAGWDAPWLGAPANSTFEAAVAMNIYVHFVNAYLDGAPADRILSQLESLANRQLIVKTKVSIGPKKRGIEDFVADLRVTVKPSEAKSGSAQAAVDELVKIHLERFEPAGEGAKGGPSPGEYRKVLDFGLEAVEPLTNNLKSHKLTRTFLGGVMMRPSQIMSIDYFVEDLILKIAKGDLGDSSDGELTKDLVMVWLSAKRKGKVEEWLMSNLVIDDKEIGNYPNYRNWNALVKSHPKLLPRAIKIARSKKVDDIWIDRAMLMPGMSDKERKALLKKG